MTTQNRPTASQRPRGASKPPTTPSEPSRASSAAQGAPHAGAEGGGALTVTLPLPPSTNNLFDTWITPEGKPIRVKSAEYKAWIKEAGYGARWERFTEDKHNAIRWRCAIVAYSLPEARDLDNLGKATLDLIGTMTGLRDRSGNLRGIGIDVADDDPEERARIVVTMTLLEV